VLLGVTYKKDIADQRESPARPIARKLRARGAAVAYHDPYVPSWPVDGQDVPRAADLEAAVAAADLVILLQAHRDYDLAGIAATARLLLDTRGALPRTPAASHIETL
jgi:UDP-N-acetyl-D-mannosaminuronate dehydrogenase